MPGTSTCALSCKDNYSKPPSKEDMLELAYKVEAAIS